MSPSDDHCVRRGCLPIGRNQLTVAHGCSSQMVNSGAVKIDINGGESILEVPAGITLLNTLRPKDLILRVWRVVLAACVRCMSTRAVVRFTH